ncbi:MAG: carboxyl-terminal processing protease [Candidatus Sumerlaeota bacterium]|nr:carboxyl-terminal processing protease [Candidatus Sumerlaeota bacterium]
MLFWKRAPKSDRFFFLASIGLLILSLTLVGVRDRQVQAAGEDEEFYRFIDVASEVYNEIRAKYVDEVEARYILEGALDGMFTALDEHSQYMAPDMLKSLERDTAGEFSGIGINIGKRQGVLTVIAPIPGSPAAEAGLLPWDRIIEIEGESTKNMDLQTAVKLLTGPAGTKVSFKVFRFGEEEELEFSVVRANIEIDSVFHKMMDDKIGYIRLARFSENTSRDTRRSLLDLKSKGAEAIILDLRYNSGGLLREAIEVSDLFLEKGSLIVSTKGRMTNQNREYYAQSDSLTRLPVFILVNDGSASASEIVAGALQDHRRGVIIGPAGENTFGKGSVQTIANLSNSLVDDEDGNPMESAMRLTTARYYTPSGRTIHHIGITPDIGVPITRKHKIELVRHGLYGEPYTGEDWHVREGVEGDEGTNGGIELQTQEPEPAAPADPDVPFFKVEPPNLVEDDFVDIVLEEAHKQLKIYMILQRGADAPMGETIALGSTPDAAEMN